MASETRPAAAVAVPFKCPCGQPYTKRHNKIHPLPPRGFKAVLATTPCDLCKSIKGSCLIFIDIGCPRYWGNGCYECRQAGEECWADYDTGIQRVPVVAANNHYQQFGNKAWYYSEYKLLPGGKHQYTFVPDCPEHDTVDLPTPPVLTKRAVTFLGGCATSIVITAKELVQELDVEMGDWGQVAAVGTAW